MPSREKKPSQIKDESGKSELVRRFKANPFLFTGTVVILVIIVIAFVFVPAIVPDAFGGGDLTFGFYNRVPIQYVPGNHFHHVQQFLMQRHQPAHDDPNFMQTVAQIWRHAFEEAAIRIGILDKMRQAGFIVPEDVINREMAELPHFQENGRFSLARYRAMDNNTRMTLWRQVHENYIVEHYLSDVANVRTPSNEVSFVSAMGSRQRTFDLAVFSMHSFPFSEIISFTEANPQLFRTARISGITVTTEREARQVLNFVGNGTMSFEEAAQKHSQDWAASRGGEMGSYMSFELGWVIANDEARESILNLQPGELTNVYRVPGGWAFYRLDEAVHQADVDDPAMYVRLRNYFMHNMRGRVEDWVFSEVERFSALAQEIGFDGAIAAEGMVKRSFGPISLNFGNSVLFTSISGVGVPELQHAGDNGFFWRAAFLTPIGTLSRPIVIDETILVLLPLEETQMDESDIGFIESYYPFWINSSVEEASRSYFLNNEKMDDRFLETFWRLWR